MFCSSTLRSRQHLVVCLTPTRVYPLKTVRSRYAALRTKRAFESICCVYAACYFQHLLHSPNGLRPSAACCLTLRDLNNMKMTDFLGLAHGAIASVFPDPEQRLRLCRRLHTTDMIGEDVACGRTVPVRLDPRHGLATWVSSLVACRLDTPAGMKPSNPRRQTPPEAALIHVLTLGVSADLPGHDVESTPVVPHIPPASTRTPVTWTEIDGLPLLMKMIRQPNENALCPHGEPHGQGCSSSPSTQDQLADATVAPPGVALPRLCANRGL